MEWTSTSLRVLRGVAEHGSFSAAAIALGYTQSSVSRQVAALERAEGARLFDRTSEGVRMTGAGRTLLRHASSALDEVDQAVRTVHNTVAGRAVVRVGLFPIVTVMPGQSCRRRATSGGTNAAPALPRGVDSVVAA